MRKLSEKYHYEEDPVRVGGHPTLLARVVVVTEQVVFVGRGEADGALPESVEHVARALLQHELVNCGLE